MKVEIKVKREVDLKVLSVKANVRYWEDSEVNGVYDNENGDNIPCKNGDIWIPEIEIETGRILNWNLGTTAEIHYKICDGCGWQLKNEKNEIIISAEDGYVPDTLSPKESGCGDYIIMSIDGNGIIEDWNFDIEDFISEEN